MKATLKTPNTLGLALWSERGHSVIVGNMQHDGEPIPVLEDHSSDAWQLLARSLADIRAVCASHIILYTNDETLATTYSKPVKLEPTAPDRQLFYQPTQWDILRHLCGYQSWQMVKHDKLPKTKAYWEQIYGHI